MDSGSIVGRLRIGGLGLLPRGGYVAPMSNAARRTGRNRCDLCDSRGSERNPLSRHHADGNSHNNDPANHMVLHRFLCHTAADFITQLLKARGQKATFADVEHGWNLLMTSDWFFRLLNREE